MTKLIPVLTILYLFAAPAKADVWSFSTPSGNIECWVGAEISLADITCTIFQRTAHMEQFPACPLHRGISAFMNNRGGVQVTCIPVSERPSGRHQIVGYGQTNGAGGITCYSSRQGLDCRNEDGHGFFLSRAAQTAF